MRGNSGGLWRLVVFQAALCVWIGMPATGATIGNVVSHTAAGQDVTFQVDDGSRVRLTLLAPDTVRVRLAPDGAFVPNISRAVVNTGFPAADYTLQDAADHAAITTADMQLVIRKQPFLLECRDPSGHLVLTDDPAHPVQWSPGGTEVFKTTQSGEKYVGLGWRTGGLVRNGTLFSMRNTPTYNDPTVFYAGIPLWYGLRDGRAYGIFFDDTSWGSIDLGATSADCMSFRNVGGQLDYYYFAGPDIATILDRYTQLTGRPFMPPRWALGYQQCRWSYYPQSQVLDIANQFRSLSIPCDVMYLDIDYMPGGRALTFDSAKFPNPAAMLSSLHEKGFRVIANISPFLFLNDPKYATARDNDYVLRRADGAVQVGWHDYWFFVGGAATGSMAWLDFSKTAARNWWADQHTPFITQGIDGIWNDENEPNELGGTWPTDLKHDFNGSPVDHHRTSNQYCLLETELSYDILRTQYPGRRPFVLSRGGFAGIQRYSAVWSGDNRCDWTNDFKQNIPMGLAMSISGNPHNGHDIAGFFNQPDATTPPPAELYARWMQAGVFSPFCRQHHDGFGNNGNPPRPFVEPWMFGPVVENICRDYIGLRYRLMPYLYTLFHQAHASGSPVQRPTLYDFPADPATLTQDYDFMVGPYLLVSPVTTPGAGTWATYLPAGAEWINWWDDSLHAGGQTVTTATPLERLPIFARAGAIIPTRAVSQFEGQAPLSELRLDLYPANSGGEFTLYEDDGESWSFQSGGYAQTRYTTAGHADTFTLQIAQRQGQFTPTPRTYLVRIHRWPNGTPAPTVNRLALPVFTTKPEFDQAPAGYFYDAPATLMYARFADSGADMVLAFDGHVLVPGDFDGDEDVDQEDFGHLQFCLTGPGIVQVLPGCANARLDGDADVDDADVARFLGCFTGPGVPGNPTCLTP